jgi:hypothetical protein
MLISECNILPLALIKKLILSKLILCSMLTYLYMSDYGTFPKNEKVAEKNLTTLLHHGARGGVVG